MPVMQRLRRLDDRVIGRSRRSTRAQAKQTFLIGLGGCIVVLGVVLVSRRPLLLSGVGGFVGITIGGAVRWWSAPRGGDEDRSMRPLTALAFIVVGGVIAAFVTMGRWSVQHDNPPGPQWYPYRSVGTMVVLCEQTPKGDAYTYQTAATDVPTCKNGAVPRIVVRG